MAATAPTPTPPKEIAAPQGWNTGPLKQRGFRRTALTIAIMATGTAIATTAVAARSQQQGTPSAAGYIEAALAVGSVIGGLAWGRRQHTRTRSTHLTALTLLLATGVAVAATAENLILLGVVMALTGLAVAPLFIVSYVASDELAPRHQRTEASTWINTANNVGAAAGAALAGALIDHAGATTAFATAAIILTLAPAAVRNGRHWIDTPREDLTDNR
jgi:predicted MFS family arabinose efflux permease